MWFQMITFQNLIRPCLRFNGETYFGRSGLGVEMKEALIWRHSEKPRTRLCLLLNHYFFLFPNNRWSLTGVSIKAAAAQNQTYRFLLLTMKLLQTQSSQDWLLRQNMFSFFCFLCFFFTAGICKLAKQRLQQDRRLLSKGNLNVLLFLGNQHTENGTYFSTCSCCFVFFLQFF